MKTIKYCLLTLACWLCEIGYAVSVVIAETFEDFLLEIYRSFKKEDFYL